MGYCRHRGCYHDGDADLFGYCLNCWAIHVDPEIKIRLINARNGLNSCPRCGCQRLHRFCSQCGAERFPGIRPQRRPGIVRRLLNWIRPVYPADLPEPPAIPTPSPAAPPPKKFRPVPTPAPPS